ncbi:MAG: hypothetical protein BRD23_02300, partial [Halobacteriales archaeon SW_9_67_25]
MVTGTLRTVFDRLREDVCTALERDPAARSVLEVLTYPGLHAVWLHRIEHRLWNGGHRLLARILSQVTRFLTGVEIHPAADIGRRVFIDHGMGTVIGETAEVGDDVHMYHGVTLGGDGQAGTKRHPTVGDGARLGASSTLVGPITVGEGATSSVGRITDMVWDLQSGTHGIQQLADRLATVFVPLVLALAATVGVVTLVLGAGPAETMLLALTVLIVSCPCALGLATPLAIASSVRAALERGVVVFDETIFERLRDLDAVVFDKTGTLTTGEMRVKHAEGPDELFERGALLETRTSHPIAAAVADAYAPSDSSGEDS